MKNAWTEKLEALKKENAEKDELINYLMADVEQLKKEKKILIKKIQDGGYGSW